jgi:hypothetical protein
MNFIKPSLLSRLKHIQKTPQIKYFSTKQTLKMPLVVPGINSGGANAKTDEWMNKLVGKKIGEGSSDATVCSSAISGLLRLEGG